MTSIILRGGLPQRTIGPGRAFVGGLPTGSLLAATAITPQFLRESHDGSTGTTDHVASGSLVIGNDVGRKVVLCITFAGTGTGLTAVTFNSVAMHNAITRTSSLTGLAGSAIYYLDSSELPAAGTYTFSATVDGAAGTVNATAIYLYNTAQGDAQATNGNDNTSTSITTSLT